MRIFSFALLLSASVILASCLDNNTAFDSAAQFKSDTTAISTYLNNFFIPAVKSPYGVWWEIDYEGTGRYPSYYDTIVVNYTGNILTASGPGTQFEQKTGTSIFALANVMAGWQIGLPRLRVGSTGKLYIPSYYAYGSTGYNSVPGNTNVMFTIQVTSVTGYQLNKDTTVITNYISLNNITNVIKDASGIRYTIDTLGTGSIKPVASSHIVATYSGKYLSSGGNSATSFGTFNTPTRYYLPGMVNAWGIILTQIKEGSTVTMYVPSGLAYGIFAGDNGIPAKANLIYQIRMTKVLP